jgi:CRP-like cAMP-binding protein
MSVPTKSIIDARRDQIFPVLETADIERMRRFARLRSFRAGEVLARAGQVADGLTIILAGKVEISRHDKLADHEPMAIHGPGQFMGELAQLAGRPALIDARALEPGEALIIPPEQLRAMLIAEVELGERIMRALILRRVNLLERGVGGPIIVGRADNGDVLRLAGSLPDLTPLRKKGTRRAVRLLQLNPRFYRHSEIRLVRTRDFGVLSDVVFMWVFGADNLLPLCYQRAPIRFDVAHLSGSRAAPKSLLQDSGLGRS